MIDYKKWKVPAVRGIRAFWSVWLLVFSLYFWDSVVVNSAIAQPPGEEKKYPKESYFDFRGKSLPDELSLTPFGSDQYVKSEPEGTANHFA